MYVLIRIYIKHHEISQYLALKRDRNKSVVSTENRLVGPTYTLRGGNATV